MGAKAPKVAPEQRALAASQARMYDEMLGMAKDQYALQREQADFLNAQALQAAAEQRGLQRQALDWAQQDRDMVDRYYREAYAYDPVADARANAEQWRAQAGATSQQQLDAAQGQLGRGLARMGVNPNSGKFAGLMNQNQVVGALGTAANINNAARAGDLALQAAKAEKLNVRGAASGRTNAGGYLGMAGQFGMTGLGAAGAGMNAYGQAFSGLNQGLGTAMGFADSANAGYNSIWQQQNARNQSGWGPALGSIAGQALGIAGGAYLGKRLG